MSEISQSRKNKERYRLEGALGYALRIAEKTQDKTITSMDELNKVIDEDFKGISASLSYHCRDNLKTAGFAVGLFDDKLTQQSQEKQN